MITIGADPEFFIIDARTGNFVPACGRFGGTKEEPVRYPGKNGYDIRYHEDNVALEVGFKEQSNLDQFTRAMTYSMDCLDNICAERGLELARGGYHEWNFSPEDLQSDQAQRFGCDPDFDAYTGGQQRPSPPDFGNWRYTGGHIHLGGKFNCPPFVTAMFMDIALGLTMSQAGVVNACNNRGNWYGQPGIFRPKPYGIEYRSPTNNWCLTYSRTYRVGHNCIQLGKYLEKTPAAQLRKDFQAVDWFKVRNVLTTPYRETTQPDHSAILNTFTELTNDHEFIRKLELSTGG